MLAFLFVFIPSHVLQAFLKEGIDGAGRDGSRRYQGNEMGARMEGVQSAL